MKKSTYTLLLSFILSLPVQAEELPVDYSIKRFSFEAGLGVNVLLPFAQLTASYRLPYSDNRWDIYLSHSANFTFGPLGHISSIGGKYYFADNDPHPKLFTFQPFFAGSLGAAYFLSIVPNNYSISFYAPAILVGMGTDMHIIDNVQLSGSLYVGYPVFVRPGLNLKIRF